MLELIKAARTQIRSQIAYVQDANVFVAENLIMIPDGLNFPAIGIKDGDVDHSVAFQDGEEQVLNLTVAVYVQNMKPEENIIGEHGVLAMIDDIITALNDNDLDIPGITLAVAKKQAGSKTLFNDRAEMVQMKTVSFRYERLANY
jgi:hypothetical protein